MKQILFILLLVTHIGTLTAQSCFPDGVHFANQQQIDDFSTDYPNCTTIEGNLTIGGFGGGGSNITNLNGLSQITHIVGTLLIDVNPALTSLSGLENITDIDGGIMIGYNASLNDLTALRNLSSTTEKLYIEFNPSLTSLAGLENITTLTDYLWINGQPIIDLTGLNNLTTVGGNVTIASNNSMTSLAGLENLTSIGGYLWLERNATITDLSGLNNLSSIGNLMYIGHHDNLQNLNGLESLTTLGDLLYIAFNDKLVSLSGIQNIDANTIETSTIGYLDLEIHDNPLLTMCEVQSICDFLGIPGKTYDIFDNMIGCNSATEIENACQGNSDCTYLTTPTNNSQNIPTNTNLIWASVSEATGYKLSIGSTTGGTDILNNQDVGNVTMYDPPVDFPCASDIFVSIVPYNAGGDITGCTEESFSTEEVIADAGNDESICSGGTVQLDANNSIGNTFSWSPATGLSDLNIANPVANPASTTTYTVTVSNDGRCPDTDEVVVTVNSNPELSGNITNGTCYQICNGSITLTVTNGASPYSYSWSNGQTTQNVNDLCEGLYSLTLTDDNGCAVTGSYTITEPSQLIANASATNETGNNFNDGTATCTPTGGTGSYSFAWSNGETLQSISNLSPGSYVITVTDENNCTSIQTVVVAEFICPILSISATINDVSCNGECDGSITIDNVANGVAPFTYEWYNGDSGATIDNLCEYDFYSISITDIVNCGVEDIFVVNQPLELFANASSTNETSSGAADGTATANPSGGTMPYYFEWSNGQTSQIVTSLAPGDYTVTVTDDNGCTAEEMVSVTAFGCLGLALQSEIVNNLCYGDCNGSIDITGVTNGTAPFTYLWANGAATSERTELCAGNYSVTVTDANNCNISKSFTIVAPQELKINLNYTNETANGANNGTATANPSGGSGGYQYNWSTGATTQSITGLVPGIYSVTLTDSNGCTITQEFTIQEYICPTINIASAIINANCYGECDGNITLTVSNGTSPYSYSWSNGGNTKTITGLCAGNYEVTITDSKNCTTTESYNISEPGEIVITVDTVQNVGGGHMGMIGISTNGEYIYNWSGPNNFKSTDEDISNLEIGCYTLVVTDTTTNCTKDTTICVEDKTATIEIDWEKSNVKLYPNPTSTEIYLDFSEAKDIKESKISLINIKGQVVENKTKKSGENKVFFDVKQLKQGYYFINIQYENRIISTKVEVVR